MRIYPNIKRVFYPVGDVEKGDLIMMLKTHLFGTQLRAGDLRVVYSVINDMETIIVPSTLHWEASNYWLPASVETGIGERIYEPSYVVMRFDESTLTDQVSQFIAEMYDVPVDKRLRLVDMLEEY